MGGTTCPHAARHLVVARLAPVFSQSRTASPISQACANMRVSSIKRCCLIFLGRAGEADVAANAANDFSSHAPRQAAPTVAVALFWPTARISKGWRLGTK